MACDTVDSSQCLFGVFYPVLHSVCVLVSYSVPAIFNISQSPVSSCILYVCVSSVYVHIVRPVLFESEKKTSMQSSEVAHH